MGGALGVDVDEQGVASAQMRRQGQMGGHRGLARPALQGDDRQCPQGPFPSSAKSAASGA